MNENNLFKLNDRDVVTESKIIKRKLNLDPCIYGYALRKIQRAIFFLFSYRCIIITAHKKSCHFVCKWLYKHNLAQHNFFICCCLNINFSFLTDFAMQRLSIERMDYSKQMCLAIFMHNVNNFDLI